MKFHIRDFYKSLSKNSTFGQNFTKRSGTLHKDLSVFHTNGATTQSAHSCASLATLSTFITLFTTYYAKIQMEHTVSLPWQKKLLRKCTRKLRYTYNSYLVHLGIRWSRDFVIRIKSCPCTIPCICTWCQSTRWKWMTSYSSHCPYRKKELVGPDGPAWMSQNRGPCPCHESNPSYSAHSKRLKTITFYIKLTTDTQETKYSVINVTMIQFHT